MSECNDVFLTQNLFSYKVINLFCARRVTTDQEVFRENGVFSVEQSLLCNRAIKKEEILYRKIFKFVLLAKPDFRRN